MNTDGGNVVLIPDARCDERIGSVFNSLFQVISSTEGCAGDCVRWDFSGVSFLHPFFLFPLRLYKERCVKRIELAGVPANVAGYFQAIRFKDFFDIKPGESLRGRLDAYLGRSYLPLCRWETAAALQADDAQSVLQQVIEKQSRADSGIRSPLSYFLGELVDNVGQHSRSRHTYVFSQYLASEGCIDLCIADEGITVYGSFVRTGKFIGEIGGNEAVALRMANDGISTKDRPMAENRGYGISKSREMLVDGLGGAFFMLSGGAFHRHDRGGSSFVNLPPQLVWDGTVVLLRIPVRVPQGFNIYNYIS